MPYKNKQDQRDAAKRHYHNNKQIYKDRARSFTKISRKRNQEFVDEYLRAHACVDCGEADIIVLEFDHIKGDKVGNISEMASHGCSLETITKEIDKCEVRCANCHKRVTDKRRKLRGGAVG